MSSIDFNIRGNTDPEFNNNLSLSLCFDFCRQYPHNPWTVNGSVIEGVHQSQQQQAQPRKSVHPIPGYSAQRYVLSIVLHMFCGCSSAWAVHESRDIPSCLSHTPFRVDWTEMIRFRVNWAALFVRVPSPRQQQQIGYFAFLVD